MQSEQMFGLLKARARRGNADLMWLVGTAYRDGHFRCIGRKWEVPVRRSVKLAMRWLERAAEKRSTGAMVDLAALLYRQGLEAKDDRERRSRLVEALRWERRAWCQGESFAAWNAAITCSALGRRKACFRWLCNSYEKSGEGLPVVALCYATGYGVRKDATKAVAMLEEMRGRYNAATDETRLALTLLAKLRRGVRIEITEPITRMMESLRTRG